MPGVRSMLEQHARAGGASATRLPSKGPSLPSLGAKPGAKPGGMVASRSQPADLQLRAGRPRRIG